jgi:ABC-2 type transport system ATP-binding protein
MDTAHAEEATATRHAAPAIEVRDVSRRFGAKRALDHVSLRVAPGEIHALLGPNGAGKTTLLRIMTGLTDADSGQVILQGVPGRDPTSRETRGLIGLVPSGDRTFYLRISGLENLLFFARLHGLQKRSALERARSCLRDVGLEEAAAIPVGQYSHGMQKRLGIARALLTDPRLLFVDEATHDLDPGGAILVRELVGRAAANGAAVVWTTQRIEEIRGFAGDVTLLGEGSVRFQGTVPQLLAITEATRFLIQLRADGVGASEVLERGVLALEGLGLLAPVGVEDPSHFMLELSDGVVLGRAAAALQGVGLNVVACREERSDIEAAFILLTMGERG